MTAATRSLATALWGARFASGLLPPSYTTTRDTTITSIFSRNSSNLIDASGVTLIVRHDASRVGTPARSGTRSSSTSNMPTFERVATVRENKWEHGMETHVGAEAKVPKLESIG